MAKSKAKTTKLSAWILYNKLETKEEKSNERIKRKQVNEISARVPS